MGDGSGVQVFTQSLRSVLPWLSLWGLGVTDVTIGEGLEFSSSLNEFVYNWFIKLLFSQQQQQIWNIVDCQRSEKKNMYIKNICKYTQKVKNNCNWTKQDKRREVWKKSSFSKLRATQKQTIYLFFASWILAEGRVHENDVLKESNWQKISELFVFMLYVALKKRISSKIRAFCLVLSN